jgi:hypothetical protein
MKKVIVNNNYTYETNLELKIGDKVVLPTPSYLRDTLENTWIGTVTALESEYDGYCYKVIRKA